YASYYLTGFLNEKPLAQLRQDMTVQGLARSDTVFEPEDNIASLMEMMAAMIVGRFGEPKPIEVQKLFFNKHIAPWAGHFFADLEAAKGSVFYAPVGTVGRALIDIESEAFRMA
ncbi:MAG: TorD/DmsD family molecular chaperone, partial [Paracoccaceae bacterium]